MSSFSIHENLQTRRITFKLGIEYCTPIEKVAKIPQRIKEIFDKLKDVRMDRAHFTGFGEFALLYEVVYLVISDDYNLFMDRQQELNLSLMKMFKEEGIQLAYPSQTLYLKNPDHGNQNK